MTIFKVMAIICSMVAIFLSGWNLSRIHYCEKKIDTFDSFNRGYLEGLKDGQNLPSPNSFNYTYFPTQEACKTCSNHPSNGGSGICNCTLGMPKIKC